MQRTLLEAATLPEETVEMRMPYLPVGLPFRPPPPPPLPSRPRPPAPAYLSTCSDVTLTIISSRKVVQPYGAVQYCGAASYHRSEVEQIRRRSFARGDERFVVPDLTFRGTPTITP